MAPPAGTLYLVATPIGNLADITYRAVDTLRSASLIACEDTRHTRKLLDHYGISTPVQSYHEHNEAQRTEELIGRLEGGADVALVSDAGTPLISDPGFRLVRAAAAAGIHVVPIPGACAAVAALSASGLPTDAFLFIGFLPRKQGERRARLESLRGETSTIVLYEAPHRVEETLEDLVTFLDDPPVVLSRELTKLHEEFLRGTSSEVLAMLRAKPSVKGEMTLVVGAPPRPAAENETPLPEAVEALVKAGLSRMDAIKQVARERGLPKREVYRLVEEAGR